MIPGRVTGWATGRLPRGESLCHSERRFSMDPYRVLGVATHASQREIKRAYRRLAFRYHPDRNPDDPESEERFKELVTAYQILSNRAKRADYDRDRAARAAQGRAETSWEPPPRPPPREDWQEVFSTLRREPMRSATPFDFDDAYLGALFSVSFTLASNVSDSSAATFAIAILAGAAVSWPFKFLSQWIASIGLPVSPLALEVVRARSSLARRHRAIYLVRSDAVRRSALRVSGRRSRSGPRRCDRPYLYRRDRSCLRTLRGCTGRCALRHDPRRLRLVLGLGLSLSRMAGTRRQECARLCRHPRGMPRGIAGGRARRLARAFDLT